ncbi:hypothetical protein K502DRAFT_219233 [Neoconidiobolus thromboides FSU 785]|nr:hypothetical protein K502DRAFT_219233 [Neoconidiobolus thromboides FSU 785]
MAIGSSHSNQTILIRQPEILELSRRGVAILVCPFENKEVTTEISYESGFRVFSSAIVFFLVFLLTLLPLLSLVSGAFIFYYTIFWYLLGFYIFNKDFLYLQIHRCPSCDRIVATAK